MLLLFVPEFASQQLAGVVRDLLQPLFQGLAAFAVEAGVAGAQRWRGGLFVAQFAARHLIATGLPGAAGLGVAAGGLARSFGGRFAASGTLPAGTRLCSLAGLAGFVIPVVGRLLGGGLALFLQQASIAASSSPDLASALPRL